MSSAVAVQSLAPADLETRLAALGIPVARLIAAAHIARSTWAAWRAGRTRPRPDRWSAATEAFAALVAEAEAAQPPGPAEPAGAEVVPLAGSSAPTGAPPRFVPVATAAPIVVDLDAALIAFAGRVARLVRREDRLVLTCCRLEDAALKILPPRPTCRRIEVQPIVNESWRADGSRGSLFDPPDFGERALAADPEHRAALADWDGREQALQERLGLPRWRKLRWRATRRLERWGLRLAGMAPCTVAGLAAKAAASIPAEGDELPADWQQALALSLGRDVVRLCGDGGAAGAPPRFVPVATAERPAEPTARQAGAPAPSRAAALDRVARYHASGLAQSGSEPEGHPALLAFDATCDDVHALADDLAARPAATLDELGTKAAVFAAIVGERAMSAENAIGFLSEVNDAPHLVRSIISDAARLAQPGPAVASGVEAAADRLAALARREWAAAARDSDADERAENDPTPRHLTAARASRRLMRRLSRRLRRDSVALAALPASGPAAVAAKARAVLAIGAATDDDPWWAGLRDSVVRDAAALGYLFGGVVEEGAGVAALAAEWVRICAIDWRDDALLQDVLDRKDETAFEDMQAQARVYMEMMRRIADHRSTSPEVLALKAAAVVASCRNRALLDEDIARDDGSSLCDCELAVALSIVRDVVDHFEAPVSRLVSAVEIVSEAAIAAATAAADPARAAA